MERSDTTTTAIEPAKTVRPVLALEREDVGNLDTVLRGYYLSQIKGMEKRKERKLARQLLENHLVLPKSRQRTSKDLAYIKEILGIDYSLLERLEESRLIRRIHKTGANPIYEVSHDTLVEPILSERRDREAIARFIKKTWKYLVLLLLLWFLFGMLFENSFGLIPDFAHRPERVDLAVNEQVVIDVGGNLNTREVSLPPLVLSRELKPSDSLFIRIPLDPVQLSSLRTGQTANSDTIAIRLASPILVPLGSDGQPATYQSFSDIVVPIAQSGAASSNPDDNQVYAKISGDVKMTTEAEASSVPSDYDAESPIVRTLGDTLVQATSTSQSVPVDFDLRLTDLFENEYDKERIRDLVGDRPLRLSYTVNVGPAPTQAAPRQAPVPSVEGIEVQYSDGTSRFIPGDAAAGGSRAEKIHIVASGETLFSIAKKYGIVDENGNTSAEPIMKLNGLRGNSLAVGQALRIPVK